MGTNPNILGYVYVIIGGAIRYIYFKLIGRNEVAKDCFSKSHNFYNLIVGFVATIIIILIVVYQVYIKPEYLTPTP